ncbi:hypothetical protein PSCICM_06630 [Pseudomonas cichorii]|uniref:hypothetical protein n=1 Tax=Pseudomonas cichorii TaxID=36746 RepID=UPI0019103CA5|nr:hypothetical protein [Pseudomonas cichorii]GFM74844.1 hypothetical protein PSCICM_06630 [Pseudomonas cichorii]
MTMHFEKITKLKLGQSISMVIAFIALIALIATPLYLHASPQFWDMKFIDIFNLVAQLATAGALLLGIHQYRRNKNNERQAILIAECRSIVDKMKHLSQSHINSESPDFWSAIIFFHELLNHSQNFDAIYRVLKEDVNKAIVRMHWQDFYFHGLIDAVKKVNDLDIFEGIGILQNDSLRIFATERKESTGTVTSFDFDMYCTIIDQCLPQVKLSTNNGICLFMLESTFFTNSKLADLLYGTINIVDPRIRIPAIHAINKKLNMHMYSA